MSISDKIIRAVDLQKGSLPHRLGRLFATGETKGHEFQISVYDGGTPVDLTGATVLGYFTHSDSSSNEVEGGTVSGNTCTISLNAACYTRSGYFEFDIRLTKDGDANKFTAKAYHYDEESVGGYANLVYASPAGVGALIGKAALAHTHKVFYTAGFLYKLAVLAMRLLPATTANWILGLMYAK